MAGEERRRKLYALQMANLRVFWGLGWACREVAGEERRRELYALQVANLRVFRGAGWACREVAGEERRRELYAPPDAGLMLRCSRYSSVTVLLSQYARHALLSCWRSIWPPIALITCMQPCS